MVWPIVVVIRMMILGSLAALMLETGTPILLAGLYALARVLLGLLYYTELQPLLFSSAIMFIPALIYFSLLNRVRELSVSWWLVFAGGLLIGLL